MPLITLSTAWKKKQKPVNSYNQTRGITVKEAGMYVRELSMTSIVIAQMLPKYKQTFGCEADLNEKEREKAQHT